MQEARYENRIVAFLDVLGFQKRLQAFEEESKAHNDADEQDFYVSPSANQFIQAFRNVLSLIGEKNCHYYLFSDNICITINPFTNKDLAVDLLFTVSELFKQFSSYGYFLRGGIDYGLMQDQEDIALGTPLANAYKLENQVANFPRVIISDNFKNFLDDICNNLEVNETDIFNKQNFLKDSCEIRYINPFYNVVRNDDKVGFFQYYKYAIEAEIAENARNEKIFLKYDWLACEYNHFLGEYLENINYFEQNIELTDDELATLSTLKIDHYGS